MARDTGLRLSFVFATDHRLPWSFHRMVESKLLLELVSTFISGRIHYSTCRQKFENALVIKHFCYFTCNAIGLIRQPFCLTMKVVENRENMKTKIFNVIAFLALCVAAQASAQSCQYVTLKSGNYAVQTNQIITLVGYDWWHRPGITGYFPDGTTTSIHPYTINNAAYATTVPNGGVAYSAASFYTSIPLAMQIFTGLTNISVSTASATFKIETPTAENVVSNYVPADAIVIPASATGNVQIILESSTDLVNWTAASPGTYGASSATNRFFRVRAAVSP